MNNKKWILYNDTREVKKLDDIYEGCVVDKTDSYPILIKKFDNKDDAIKELSLEKYKTSVYVNFKPYRVEEYYIEEVIEDADGKFIDSIGYYFKKIKCVYCKQ